MPPPTGFSPTPLGPSKGRRGTDPTLKEEDEQVNGRERAWIAITILSTLLLPVAGSDAGQHERLERLREEREQLDRQIETHEAQAGSLQAEARALNEQMIVLRKELAILDRDIERISAKVRSAQARIDQTQSEIDKVEGVASNQAVALYKTGATESLDALLGSKTLSELDDRLEFLGVAAEENTGALIRFHRLQLTIQAQHQELFNTQQDLKATRNEQARVFARLDESHTKLKDRLGKIEDLLGREYAQEGDLTVEMARIVGDIRAAQAVRAVTARGVSTQGFIWPLNGAITSYYGERWGRMHTGIDIDGTSGQPVVASKDGAVIMASSYSGYGNTVIIDHGGGVATLYAHLSSFEVRSGQAVSQGEIVGGVGCTGSCTGDHLHFEVRVNGSPQDPMKFLP
jgi:murein DD-endopeptidase MepM/ murein hydrolase activator NlpD